MLDERQSGLRMNTQILDLIDLIYSAAADVTLWPTVVDRIANAVCGEQTVFWAPFYGPGAQPAFSSTGTAPEALHLYSAYYHALNILDEPCDRRFPLGTVRYSHWVINDSEFERSEFYSDFFRPLHMYYSCGIKIPLANEAPAYLCSQRAKGRGGFEENEGGVFQVLLPHLRRSLQLHAQFAQMKSHLLGAETALEAFEHAVLGLDCKGKMVFASQQAEALLRAGDGIYVSRGKLATQDASLGARLNAAIGEALKGPVDIPKVNASLLIHRKSHPAPLQLTVVPHRTSLPGSVALAALVFIGDPSRRSASRSAVLRSLYDLTPTETRVAGLLAEGLTIREISAQLQASAETVRFHTKKILAKTGTRRQAELMKLILTLPNV